MIRRGVGSIADPGILDSPEMKARAREELVVTLSPRLVAKKLGIPQSLLARWRNEFLRDPQFVEAVEAFKSCLMGDALDGYALGLRAARRIAVGPNVMAAAQAAKALLGAPGDLARAQNQLTVKLTGTVTLDSVDELERRIAEAANSEHLGRISED